ncbi:unnamed protein product [Echinostoma caproni]|uniref:Uncharacterized protein n=1 Tax=Echinostoma caproni TaxID=27848 RepID=A0A183ANI8_9TREM|nr:unnamed protein product [Echinostoma caproni]
MCNYVPTLIFQFLIKLVLIHLSVEFLTGPHVHHTASAALINPSPPRLTGPAGFYFQLPPHRRRSTSVPSEVTTDTRSPATERADWLTKWEQESTSTDNNNNNQQQQQQLGRRVKDLFELGAPDPSDPTRSVLTRCGGMLPETDCQKKDSHGAISTEQTRKQMIEKYKHIILKQMNLDHVPSHPPITENATSWKSLPVILRNRLKAEVDTSNQLMDDPVEEDEEKESFILLKQCKFEFIILTTNAECK